MEQANGQSEPASAGVLLLGVGALYLWIRPRLAAEEG